MIELYLLLTFVGNQPSVQAFSTENDACQALEAKSGGSQVPFLYKESVDRHGSAVLTEGVCKPLKQFVPQK